MLKVIIIGPAHPLRGGLATFDHRLAKQFIEQGAHCSIYSFSLQYPSFLFPGKTQYSDEPAPENIEIFSLINSINPLNWVQVGNRLRNEKPHIIVVRYWLPFMGPALGTILRRVRKNHYTRIICIADNVVPHEHRPGDRSFTKYFLQACDGFIAMSEKVVGDLQAFHTNKPVKLVQHPLYDNFGQPVSKSEAREKLRIDIDQPIILFFGFIRKYKGLDILLDTMSILKRRAADSSFKMPKLLVAGEFYEDERPYQAQIDKLNIRDDLILHTQFIPDAEVKYYLSAADAVIQPYRNATQSGVTPLAYFFEKPMIVTNVGGLPSLVPHQKSGLVTEPTAESIAEAIVYFYQLGENYFLPHLRSEKQKYSWANMVNTIKDMGQES